ncbi:alpha-galactosidase a [Diaporthe amygdali]|uniref:alpha-galactosidase a n=1 Tax=Phomopsis amygdali TaxID=1214568 RepID=UPI0022FDDEA2|nr:alpha-galactosidase a [Diaporthe amygdali]KAJ0120725.1 alpha-galactosidase a [Diaporthe amygdali]
MARAVPRTSIEVLSQEVNDEQGMYRIRAGQRVHYLTIPADVFDEDTMSRPNLLIPQLPEFPDTPWTKMHLGRNIDGSLTVTMSDEPLEEVTFTWHEKRIDVLSLPYIKRLKFGVYETRYQGREAIAKIACFGWQIPRLTHETWAYCVLAESRQPDDGRPIAPEILGHLTENGRVIGFLMEKVEGRFACLDDLPRCEALLRRLHSLGDLGLVHGDINRYNFIIRDDPPGSIYLVDFEHAEDYEEAKAHAELESLPAELAEETGRGTTRPLVEVRS